jgi:NADH-quinone oxidoreductase subunit J
MVAPLLRRLPIYPSSLSNYSVEHPVRAAQSLWLIILALLGVPTVIVLAWVFEHLLFSAVILGWAAFAELALPLGACIFATIVFLVPNPMHALLSLLGVFFTTVLFYLAAGIEFVGLVFLIVYVGAVAILFLFVIMLLNVKSLTSKEPLLQHITQGAAILSALVFFQQLYARVLRTLAYAMTGEHVRSASVESTTGDAVLFYVRYGAADINRLVALYTLHAPNFLIITIILLVALLGAIILATVTTERATAVSDIRAYADVPAVAFLFIAISPLRSPELAPYFLDLLSLTLEGLFGAVFVSLYLRKSRRNVMIIRKQNDYTDSNDVKDTSYLKLRRLVPSKTVFVTNGKLQIIVRQPLRRGPKIKNKKRKMQPHRKFFLFRGALPFKFTTYYARRLKQAVKAAVAARFVTSRVNGRYLWHSRRIISRSRWLWLWRAERALWLLRPRKEVIKHYGEAFLNRKKAHWKWGYTGAVDPFNIFTLHPLAWLRYFYLMNVFPFLYYWAWRARAFTGMFLFFTVAIPVVLVPAPWFLSDYDVVWHDLCKLHTQTYNFTGRVPVLASFPVVLKEFVTLLLLYPAAAINIVLAQPWKVLGIAGLYAYDKVLFTGGDFARAELHDSTCNYFRILSDRTVAKRLAPTEATIAWRRRHPDRGRTDGFWVRIIIDCGYFPGMEWVEWWLRFNVWFSEKCDSCGPNTIQSIINWCTPDVFDVTGFRALKIPFSVLALFLVPVALVYGISSIFVLTNWRRVYGGCLRPPFLWPIIAFVAALYVGIFWCNRAALMHEIFGELSVMYIYSNVEDAVTFAAFIVGYMAPFLFFIYSYLFYRSYFTEHQIFATWNIRMLRRFINYYLRTMGRLFYEVSPRFDAKAAVSLAELEVEWSALQVHCKHLQEKKITEARRFKYVHYKKVNKPHDPDLSVDKVPRSSSPAYPGNPFIS